MRNRHVHHTQKYVTRGQLHWGGLAGDGCKKRSICQRIKHNIM